MSARPAILKARQRLHRDELKLARLKTRQNKERREDARLKLRLGGLCYLVGWEKLSEQQLEERIIAVLDLVRSSDHESLSTQGSNLLNLIMSKKVRLPSSALPDPELRRKAIHEQITVGGMFVKYDLQNYSKSILLGAIFTISDFSEFGQIIERICSDVNSLDIPNALESL